MKTALRPPSLLASLALALTLAPVALASVNPTEMVDVDSPPRLSLEVPSHRAPTVRELAERLRSEGHGPVDEVHLARSLAGDELHVDGCPSGAPSCRRLEVARPAPMVKRVLTPGPMSLGPSPGPPSGGGDILPLLVGILQLFLGLSSSGATLAGPGFPGAGPMGPAAPGPGFRQASFPSSPGSRTGLRQGSGLFGAGSNGVPGFDTSGRTGPGTVASPASGGRLLEALPLPEGSWAVRNNGHFWDCRGGDDCDRPHHGLDLRAPEGTPVYAVADGTITRVKYDANGYHWYVVIQHDATSSRGRKYNTLYAHIDLPPDRGPHAALGQGMRVRAGQQIGTVSSHKVSFTHLHFEILEDDGATFKGTPLNPNAFYTFHEPSAHGRRFASYEPSLGRGLV